MAKRRFPADVLQLLHWSGVNPMPCSCRHLFTKGDFYTPLFHALSYISPPSQHMQLYMDPAHFPPFGLLLPIFHPHPLSVLTTFGVTAAVSGTLIKMKLL